MNLFFIHGLATLLHKDQSSPSSWQWLTRFEFGTWSGVSTWKLFFVLFLALSFYFSPVKVARFYHVRCLERSRPMREFKFS